MNARYVLCDSPTGLAAHFGIAITDNFPPRYNIAPSQPVAVIRQRRHGREYALMRWGFVPGWDRQGTWLKKAVVNIRGETAREKNSFRHAWRRRRCLLPVNALYVWVPVSTGKQPYVIARGEDMPLFALGGLWEDWMGEDGSEMTTTAFLTRESAFPLSQFHDRMPVFVPPERYDDWLDTNELDDNAAREMVAAKPDGWVWWKVSERVNSWKPDDSGLIRPLDIGSQQTLW